VRVPLGLTTAESKLLMPVVLTAPKEGDEGGVLRQRWWKLCLQRKCTVGRSSEAEQAEQRVALKVSGLFARRDISLRFLSVSVR
jgi:hypothetical protein